MSLDDLEALKQQGMLRKGLAFSEMLRHTAFERMVPCRDLPWPYGVCGSECRVPGGVADGFHLRIAII